MPSRKPENFHFVHQNLEQFRNGVSCQRRGILTSSIPLFILIDPIPSPVFSYQLQIDRRRFLSLRSLIRQERWPPKDPTRQHLANKRGNAITKVVTVIHISFVFVFIIVFFPSSSSPPLPSPLLLAFPVPAWEISLPRSGGGPSTSTSTLLGWWCCAELVQGRNHGDGFCAPVWRCSSNDLK
ncbi:hypothetical protein NL676_013893 [Syzygium grande]|nr:hypothetical protein NL676_013893 [Syzygium grande]